MLGGWDWLIFAALIALALVLLRGRIRRAIAARAVAPPFDPEAVLRKPEPPA